MMHVRMPLSTDKQLSRLVAISLPTTLREIVMLVTRYGVGKGQNYVFSKHGHT